MARKNPMLGNRIVSSAVLYSLKEIERAKHGGRVASPLDWSDTDAHAACINQPLTRTFGKLPMPRHAVHFTAIRFDRFGKAKSAAGNPR